jgi:uncharacterized protein (DUF1330 family)
MAAYVVGNWLEVLDAAAIERYRREAPAIIEKYGGRYLVRVGAVKILEGDVMPKRLTVIEFPSVERAKAWYHSPEYRPLAELRQSALRGDLFIVEGV